MTRCRNLAAKGLDLLGASLTLCAWQVGRKIAIPPAGTSIYERKGVVYTPYRRLALTTSENTRESGPRQI